MSADELGAGARRWLDLASEDLLLAQVTFENLKVAPRGSCWHAQQCAEKAIKSILVLENIDFPFIHDLRRLLALVPETWDMSQHESRAISLTIWSIAGRYPGDFPAATREVAEEAIQIAADILGSVQTGMSKRNIDF